MEADIRDFKDWTWEFIDTEYKGIPMKHAIDMLCSTTDIKFEKECPTQATKSFFREFMGRGSNTIYKFTPEEGIALPDSW